MTVWQQAMDLIILGYHALWAGLIVILYPGY